MSYLTHTEIYIQIPFLSYVPSFFIDSLWSRILSQLIEGIRIYCPNSPNGCIHYQQWSYTFYILVSLMKLCFSNSVVKLRQKKRKKKYPKLKNNKFHYFYVLIEIFNTNLSLTTSYFHLYRKSLSINNHSSNI